MSEENVEVVRQVFEAFNRRDWAAWKSHHDPDVEWHDPPGVPGGGVHRGAGPIVRFLEETLETAAEWRADVEEVESVGHDRVLMRGRSVVVWRGTSVPMEDPLVVLFDLDQGRVRRVRHFRSSTEALEVAGLEE